MPKAQIPKELQDEHLLDQISRHVFLVVLNISWPKLSHQISEAVVEVDDAEVDRDLRSNPQWQLMPDSWRRSLSNLEHRARSLLTRSSVSFSTRGMALLPVARAGEVFNGLRSCRDEMDSYREDFSSEYSDILDRLKERLGDDLYSRATRKLPEPNAIRGKFGMVWAIIPLGGSSHVDTSAIRDICNDMDDMRDAYDEVHDAVAAQHVLDDFSDRLKAIVQEANSPVNVIDDLGANDMIQEARAQMQSFAAGFVDQMAREPRQALQDAVNNLITSIREGRRIQTGTIGQVRSAFELVRGFRFLADSELLRRIDSLESQLDTVTPQQLNSDRETSSNLAVALRHVSQQAADAKAASTAIRNFRGINMGRSQRRNSRGGGADKDELEPAAALA